MNIYEKLSAIQQQVKAPKNQTNDFGGFNYRSCEDILEVAKPIIAENKTVLYLTDDIVNVGERYYIQSTAILQDLEGDGHIEVNALAREIEQKTKMDSSQLTGVASSYARKYALSGLLDLDDNKDPDSNEYQKQKKQAEDDARLKAEKEAWEKAEKELYEAYQEAGVGIGDIPIKFYEKMKVTITKASVEQLQEGVKQAKEYLKNAKKQAKQGV